MMKRVLASLAASVALVLALPAAASETSDLFATRCASCHGKDGKGSPIGQKMGAPDLTKVKASPAELEKTITDGKGKMAAYKGKLTPEQIKGLAMYVKAGLK